MNDHNLDDLIIDTAPPKHHKTKNLLTIIALLIIILIVGIILTKTLLVSPQIDELSFEENISEMLAPELKPQTIEEETSLKLTDKQEELSLPKPIEKAISTPEPSTEAIDQKHKQPEKQNKDQHTNTVTQETKPTKTETKPAAKPQSQTTPKPTHKPKTQPKPKEPTKPQKPKPTPKPVKKPIKHTKPQPSTKGNYYVQVGSFKTMNPSGRLLSVIKSSGFSFHITPPDHSGYKKLLIGPYKTRAEVDKAKEIIRDRIIKSAFVVER